MEGVVGRLERVTGDRSCWLPSRLLVGRSPSCLLRIHDKRVSGEHARLEFVDGTWTVRDLGSRNGTLVDGQRVPSGHTVPLEEGHTVCFGSAGEGWTLISAAPPQALAVAADGSATIRADSGFLTIPEDRAPEVYVYQRGDGRWVAEHEDESRVVRDQEPIAAAGRSWVLHLPTGLDATWSPPGGERPCFGDLALRFVVSADEEHVDVHVHGPGGEWRLPSRAHDYLLLTLARLRLRDRSGGCGDVEEGWVGVPELCRMIRVTENKLGVDIHRARRSLAALGVRDAAKLVERHRGTREIRIGVRDLQVASSGHSGDGR